MGTGKKLDSTTFCELNFLGINGATERGVRSKNVLFASRYNDGICKNAEQRERCPDDVQPGHRCLKEDERRDNHDSALHAVPDRV